MKPYLLLYNLANAAGWAIVLKTLADCYFAQQATPAQAWAQTRDVLLAVQSLAALEIVHSLVGFVKSPVMSTFMQVFSRYAVLWGYTYAFKEAQTHWSFYLMAGSWSLVEVPRYLFYAVNLYTKNVPFPLFWLRYSLFAILYPSGISGEILQITRCMGALKAIHPACWYGTCFLLFLYVPGSPFMFMHMVKQRGKSFKARKEGKDGDKKPAPPSAGVDFPLDPKTGQRSTTVVNQGAIAASSRAVDPAAGDAAAKERNWRFGYAKHVVKNVELCCKSNAACMKAAQAGLTYLHEQFEFVEGDKTMSVAEAMKTVKGTFHTHVIKGTGTRPKDFQFNVPYQKFDTKKVKDLKGEELLQQLNKWCTEGKIEPEARDGIAAMVKNPEYHGKALQDKYFVLLGAGSAMGPLRVLLELGANVIAVDLDRDFIWKRLVTLARESPGTMILPLKKDPKDIKDDDDLFKSAGADLLSAAPKIANWLVEQQKGKQLVLGGYAYLDSALFVRLAIAMDAIIARVIAERKDAALAFLCSPTDVFVTKDACHDAQKKAFASRPLWQRLLQLVMPKKMLVKNAIKQVTGDDKETYSIVDGLAVAQGPNYALAKRLQHWRCMLAREAGHTVSTNIAPSTATVSVVHNPQFAAAYKGMGYFRPMEIVYQDLSNAVMTALLLFDVCAPDSAANPKTNIGNQIRLFASGSCHFGIWRMAFKCGSIGEVSALIGYCKIYSTYLYLVAAALAGFAAMVVQKGAPHTW